MKIYRNVVRQIKYQWWKLTHGSSRKFMRTGLKYFMFGMSAIIGVLCILLLSQKIADIFDKQGHWDAMAFTGSIVGGVITLVAVKLTLHNQYRMDFMQHYPEKKKSMDEVFDRLYAYFFYIRGRRHEQIYDTITDTSESLLQHSEELKKMALNTGVQVYSLTNAILAEVEALRDYMKNPLMDQDKKTKLLEDCYLRLYEHIEELGKFKMKMEKRYTKLLDPEQDF